MVKKMKARMIRRTTWIGESIDSLYNLLVSQAAASLKRESVYRFLNRSLGIIAGCKFQVLTGGSHPSPLAPLEPLISSIAS